MNTPRQQPATPSAPSSAVALDEGTVFKTLFSAYPDGLLVSDAHGTIVLANPTAATLLGYEPAELTGLNIDVLVPDAIRPKHASYREAYGRHPRARPMGTQMELVAKRKDGSEVMVEIALSPLQDHGLPLVVAAIRDIGAYPRVKQALKQARYSESLAQIGRIAVDERDPQVLLDRAPDIARQTLEVDAAMVFLAENDLRFVRVAAGVGMVPGEEIGARIPYDPDSSPGLVLSQGVPLIVADYRRETRFVPPQRYLDAGLVSALSVPISDRGRIIGAFTVRSRRERQFGEDEVRFLSSMANLLATSMQRTQSEEALNHAQRLESVGQLTGGIAHDFNNLLTVIQGNLQVLEELPALAGDAYGQQLVGAATRATHRAAELTGKLLAFSRRQVLQPRPIDVNALLLSFADMLGRTLDQRIRIEVEPASARPQLLADPGQLEAALLNIAINARDAMPDGGLLRFKCDAGPTLSPTVREGLDDPRIPDERFVAISISDTGTGMSDDIKERVFEPFFTTKEAGRGTGLGLSTVYGFVRQSKGAISISSAPGAGTEITLYIPQAAIAAPELDSGADGEVPAGTRVLLVEDDAEVRSVISTFLRTLKCEVRTASSAEQALLLLEPGAGFDLLLTDIALGPGMRGTELAAQAVERLPGLHVLLMSGYSADLLDADRTSPANWELLRKPYGRGELARAMAHVLAAAR